MSWEHTGCVCFSHGASSASCVDMKPGHIGAHLQYTHLPSTLTIHTSRGVYLPLHTLMVSVRSSRAFMGLLLQARSVPGDHVVGGEFTLHPPGTHTLSCLSTGDTVTHSDKLLKRNLSFTWRAPSQPSGDLRFYITVVYSYFVYGARIRSSVVHDGTRSVQGAGYGSALPTRILSASFMRSTDIRIHTSVHNTLYSQNTTARLINLPTHILPAQNMHTLPRNRNSDTQPFTDSEGDSTGHNPPQRPRETSRAPDREGAKPDGVPRQSMPELGLLLGLSAALGMAVAVGLRYLQRKHCRKRTAVSLGDRSHDNRGVIHVQECGDLVQVRRIRENSFLLLQTEYNLITAPGN
ncbi:reelin domain-containing protein 1-like [Brachyhypopomus gauderio]|uniref:reelin domain-containing protein 1-like n=1 Tax=Brachyhypopomus gauderio TaxID=698409 RepID=UPI004041F503